MHRDQAILDHYSGLIVDLQKRVYALERELRQIKLVRKTERRSK